MFFFCDDPYMSGRICINFSVILGYKVHFSAGFQKIGNMALKNFEGKYKAVKATCVALKIGQGSGHKWRYVHEKYDEQKRKDIKWRCIVAPKFCILLERLQTYKEE